MVLCAPVFTVFRCGGAGSRRGGCARSGCSAGFGGRSGGCRAGVRGEAYANDRHPAVSGGAGPGSGGAGLVSGGIGGVSGGIGRDVWADGDGRGLSEDTGRLALSGGIGGCTDRRRMPGAGVCIGRRNEKASPTKGGFRVGGGGGRSAGGYFTRRLVAVSGKMTHGRNCFASSKSISA
jgi:hypothetical protein